MKKWTMVLVALLAVMLIRRPRLRRTRGRSAGGKGLMAIRQASAWRWRRSARRWGRADCIRCLRRAWRGSQARLRDPRGDDSSAWCSSKRSRSSRWSLSS